MFRTEAARIRASMEGPDDYFQSGDGVIRVGRFGPIFAGVYYKGLSARALDKLRAWQHGVMPSEPILSYSLSFAAQRLDEDTKNATNRLLADFRDRTRGSATILATQGFDGSAARAMLATIYLLTRAAYPRRVFAKVADAHKWFKHDFEDVKSIGAATRWLSRIEQDYWRRGSGEQRAAE